MISTNGYANVNTETLFRASHTNSRQIEDISYMCVLEIGSFCMNKIITLAVLTTEIIVDNSIYMNELLSLFNRTNEIKSTSWQLWNYLERPINGNFITPPIRILNIQNAYKWVYNSTTNQRIKNGNYYDGLICGTSKPRIICWY